MAKKVIKQEDLIERGIFEEPIKQSEDLLAIIKSLKEEFKGLAKVSLSNLKNTNAESAEGAKELAKETQKANVIVNQFNKLSKDEEAILKRVNDIKAKASKENTKYNKTLLEEAKADLKLRTEKEKLSNTTRKLNAEVKKTVAVQQAEIGSINKLRAETSLLIAERNKLDVTTKEGRKEAERLNIIIDKNTETIKTNVSAFEKQKLNIGNYKDSVKQALAETGLFSKELGGLSAASDVVGNAFANTKKQVVETAAQMKVATTASGKAAAGFKLAGLALKSAGIGLVLAGIAGIAGFFTQFEEGADALAGFAEGVKIFSKDLLRTFKEFAFSLVRLPVLAANSLTKVGLSVKKLALEIADAIPGVDNAEGIKAVNKQIEELDKKDLGNLLDAFDGLGDRFGVALAKGVEIQELLDSLAAKTRLLSIAVEDLNAQEAIQSERASDVTLSFAEREKALDRLTEIQQERLTKEKALANETLALQIRIASARTGASEAEIKAALQSQQAGGVITDSLLEELTTLQLVVAKKESEINVEAEKRAQKARFIRQKEAIDSINILRDFIAIEEGLRDKRIKRSNNDRVVELQEFDKFRIKLQESFDREIEILQKAANGKINVGELLSIDSATQLEEAIKKVGLSDKLTDTLGDVLKDYKKGIQEFNDNNEVQLIKVSKADIKAVEDTTDEIIKQSEFRVAKVNALKNLEEKRVKKAQEEERKAIAQTSELVIDEINRRADAQLEANQKQIDSRKESITRQQELAEKGLDNTLEFEQKKLAEAELKQKELEEAKVRREKVIAFYKILQSSVLDGDSTTAPFRALATITASEAIAATLGGLFADGGYTGDGNGKKDSTGFKRAGIVHEGEYVIPKKILDTPMGAEIAETAERMRVGASPRYSVPIVATQNLTMQNELIKIREAISKQKQVDVSWDSFDNRIEKIKVEAYTRTIKHVKKRSRI